MSSLDRYTAETEHLNEDQRTLYEVTERTLLHFSQGHGGFVNCMIAVEALAKTMRLSYDTIRRTYH